MNFGSCARCWERHHVCTCSEEEIREHEEKRKGKGNEPVTTIVPPREQPASKPSSFIELVERYGFPDHDHMPDVLTIKHTEEPKMIDNRNGAPETLISKHSSTERIYATVFEKANEVYPYYPIINSGSKGHFLQGHEVIQTVHAQGVTLETAPLKPGNTVDLLGISAINQYISQDKLSVADTIDPLIHLKNIYISIGGSLLKFCVRDQHEAVGMAAPHGDTHQTNIAFNTDKLVIDEHTLDVNGQPFNYAHVLKRHGLEINLAARFGAGIETQKGIGRFDQGGVHFKGVGSRLNLSEEILTFATALIHEVVGTIEFVGFDLDAKFTTVG